MYVGAFMYVCIFICLNILATVLLVSNCMHTYIHKTSHVLVHVCACMFTTCKTYKFGKYMHCCMQFLCAHNWQLIHTTHK